jgi:hypothetical protein
LTHVARAESRAKVPLLQAIFPFKSNLFASDRHDVIWFEFGAIV